MDFIQDECCEHTTKICNSQWNEIAKGGNEGEREWSDDNMEIIMIMRWEKEID